MSLNLSDAYLHIPMFLIHRKYLRFCFHNQCYQFKVFCFGLTSAPTVFTITLSIVAVYLRTLRIKLAVYLDNWLVVNQSQKVQIYRRSRKLSSLGFIAYKEKSTLIPTQKIFYLGALFHLDRVLIFLSQ